MTSHFIHIACYLVVFTVCIDQGDGRRKKKGREMLEQEIAAFRKMADNIEHEIEDFYDAYPDEERLEDNKEGFYYKEYVAHYHNEASKQRNNKPKFEPSQFPSANISSVSQTNNNRKMLFESDIKDSSKAFVPVSFMPTESKFENGIINKNSTWPTFEEMLLSLGKVYDWKNDRWIKVKEKLKKAPAKLKISDSRVDFLSKHKFNYRFVKLNRSKSKRNVIMAVKAVR